MPPEPIVTLPGSVIAQVVVAPTALQVKVIVCDSPINTLEGDASKLCIVGATGALDTVSVCALEVPPPGVGLNTVIDLVPAEEVSEERILAES